MLLTIPCGPSPRDNRGHGSSLITAKRRRRPRHAARIGNARPRPDVHRRPAPICRRRRTSRVDLATRLRSRARTLGVWLAAGLLVPPALWYAAPVTLVPIIAVPVTMTIFPVVLAVVGAVLYILFAAARLIWRWIALPIRYLERLLVAALTSSPARARALDRHDRALVGASQSATRTQCRCCISPRPCPSGGCGSNRCVGGRHPAPDDGRAPRRALRNGGAPERVPAFGRYRGARNHRGRRRRSALPPIVTPPKPRKSSCSTARARWVNRGTSSARLATRPASPSTRCATAPGSRSSAGHEHAEPVYPAGGGLAQATSTTRAAAKAALRWLWPEGGTAMGQWLLFTRELFASRPSAIPHAILLTDGKNESESPASLEAALGTCSGQFQCDCRGIGTDWNVGELRAISARLLGTVDIVRDPTELADDFRAMTEAAMAKEVGGSDAPGVDAAGREGPVHQAGRARRSLISRRCAHPSTRARASIPPARGVTRHASTTSASKSRRARSARRCSRHG